MKNTQIYAAVELMLQPLSRIHFVRKMLTE